MTLKNPEKRKAPQPSPEEMAKWDAILAAQGMPADVGEDIGAKALRKQMESEGQVVSEEKKREAIREYWVTRGETLYGDHLKAAQDIAHQLGLKAGDIDEAMMNEVAGEISQTEQQMNSIATDLISENPNLRINPKLFRNRIMIVAKDKFPSYARETLRAIADEAVGRITGM